MTKSVSEILQRDLQKLAEEISSYTNESLIWKTIPGISNSAGNLCLHLCGNLQHFIGAVLGGSPYIRNRDAEFSWKDIPRERLLAEIQVTKNVVRETLLKMDPSSLTKNFPEDVLGKVYTTEFFLIHLIAHFNYHLGQVNYHKRLVK